MKFGVFQLQNPLRRHVRFMDSTFYSLHDQYYLFTVLNGFPFEHLTRYPVYPGDFRTWAELDHWARGQDLSELFDAEMATWAGDRLISRYFYSQINGDQRDLGVGTLVHQPAEDGGEDFWGFELEYADAVR